MSDNSPMDLGGEEASALSPFSKRRAGVLLHPSSLPGDFGGNLGEQAYKFVRFLSDCGLTVWQTLPLGPTHSDRSPYQCISVFAGNPRLISLELLSRWQWIDAPSAKILDKWSESIPLQIMSWVFDQFHERTRLESERQAFSDYCKDQNYWLDDYALYQALRDEFKGKPWMQWPVEYRDRYPEALVYASTRLSRQMDLVRFEQFVFQYQWLRLKSFANQHGILLFGDLPIFVAHDSAEVWAKREYFTLKDNGQPSVVAGVPPDYFSETGQLWGNPLYDWERMRSDDFTWWHKRIEHQLVLFDLIRIDHFRGFEAYWEVPADAESAREGRWVKAPGEELFEELHQQFDPLPLVAEDLGFITPEVIELRKKFNLPGMKILQFAFDGDSNNPYLPENHQKDSVVYTGTHDNNTTLGWFSKLDEQHQNRVMDYLGQPKDPMPWPLIQACIASQAQLSILPMQDLLALGSEHRMNIPGTSEGNWSWRFKWDQIDESLPGKIKQMLHDVQR